MLPLLLSLAAAPALAEDEVTEAPSSEGPAWTVTVDPLTTALGYVHLQVERRLSPHTSLYVGPHMRLFDGVLTEGHEPYVGFGAEAGFRWFPWGSAPEGGWVMARTVLARLSTTDGSQHARPGGYSSALVGGTVILGDHFVLSGGAGVNYLYYSIDGYGPSGPFIALHSNLGVAF